MKFRIARHTSDLTPIIHFYHGILGLDILGSFHDHDSYNGIFLGKKGTDWHLEFTMSEEPPHHHADDDDLLVFYVENQAEYDVLLAQFQSANIPMLPPKNPYWKANGATFADPDGYRIVISKQ